MRYLALVALLLASPAFAEDAPPAASALQTVPAETFQSVVSALRQQREAAMDQAASAAVQIEALRKQLDTLTKAAAPTTPRPPTPKD